MCHAIIGLIPGRPFWHGVMVIGGNAASRTVIVQWITANADCMYEASLHHRHHSSNYEAALIVPDLRAIDCDIFHERSTETKILLKGLTQSFTMGSDRESGKRGVSS
jgi:hypothetical protein